MLEILIVVGLALMVVGLVVNFVQNRNKGGKA